MKKGPLSGEEKEYIKNNYQGLQIEVMAEKLERSLSIVQKFVEQLPAIQPDTKGNAQNLYARKVERGVVASTQAASMAADESRANNKDSNNTISPRYNKFIHKIKK